MNRLTPSSFFSRLWLLWLLLTGLISPLRAEQFGDFTYSSDGSEITITQYTGSATEMVIPNIITGLPVKAIANEVVYENNILISIVIPDSVTSIEAGTFKRCSKLRNFSVDDDNPNYRSVGGVLFDKTETSLQCFPAGRTGSYIIPDHVATIGAMAFYACKGLSSISIPSSVTKIEHSAFAGCSGLANLVIPNGVTSIERDTFGACTSLKSFTIPESVTAVGWSAFAGCVKMANISIGSNVRFIGANAFWGCTDLTSAAFPYGITSIEEGVFSGCARLASVAIPDSVISIEPIPKPV